MQPDNGGRVPDSDAQPVREERDRELGQRQFRAAPAASLLTESSQRGLTLTA
jgi:hypothetical protein